MMEKFAMTDWQGVIQIWGWERLAYHVLVMLLAVSTTVGWIAYGELRKQLRALTQTITKKEDQPNKVSSVKHGNDKRDCMR